MWVDGCEPVDVTRAVRFFALTCLVLSLAAPAQAQDEPLGPDPVASDLFQQGRAFIEKGDWEAGCEKLEMSMKRFPAPSTLMNIARCREHEGRVATAWALYKRALVLNLETDGAERRRELDEVGKSAIAALEPRLPRLRITLSSPVEDVVVSEGGEQLPLDTAVALDPGEHELDAEAPGHQPIHRKVVLREGETTRVELTLVALPPPPASAPDHPVKAKVPQASTPIWVWLVGGAGIAMAGVAIGFGVDARLATDELTERCGDDQVCDEDPDFDPAPGNARKNRGLGLSVGFGVGALAALTAATVGLVTSSEPTAVTWLPLAWPEGGGLAIRGRF
jgi:hypothetical protein